MSLSRSGGRTTPPRSRRSLIRFPVTAAILASALALSGCSTADMPRFGLPIPATEEGDRMLFLWQTAWIAALIIGMITFLLIMWAVVFYSRKRRSGYPSQTRYNFPIEILYTLLPLIVIGVFFYYTARDQAELTALTNDADNRVNVVGFRWSWAFNYLDEGAYDIGLPAVAEARETTRGAAPGDPGTGPTIWLPVGEKTRFILTSPDVIHSFYVPAFLWKMDVIPGRTNQFELTPNRIGNFAGKCAELCGLDHSRMLFNVKVVSRADYERHMIELKARGQSGEFSSGRVSDAAEGKQGRFRFNEQFTPDGSTK